MSSSEPSRLRDRCPGCGRAAVQRTPRCSPADLEGSTETGSLWCYFQCRSCQYRFRRQAMFREGDYHYGRELEAVSPEMWSQIKPTVLFYPVDMGNEIERSFFSSWDMIEDFFSHSLAPRFAPLCKLIENMRLAKYDRRLRAGQSLSTLILSRGKRHGTYSDSIEFDLQGDGQIAVRASVGSQKTNAVQSCELTQALIALLDRLAAAPVFDGDRDQANN